MTDFLREWTLALAGIIVFGSLCEMILPDGVYKKYIQLAIGLMLCIALLSPLKSGKIKTEYGFFEEDIKASSKDYDKAQKDEVLKVYKNKLAESIRGELSGSFGAECEVICNVSGDEEDFGTIKDIEITAEAKNAKISDEAIEAIRNMYGNEYCNVSVKYLK